MSLLRTIAPPGSRRRKLARQVRRRLPTAARGSAEARQPQPGRAESRKLRESWARHRPEVLDNYLVIGYQNPRINAASMLARHFFVRKLFGSQFDQLMRDELKFCVEANKLIRDRAKQAGVRLRPRIDPAQQGRIEEICSANAEREESFERTWREELSSRTASPLSVLELACGSANDYRFFDSYGLAQFLEYTGVDLNKDNIENARRRFPNADFRVGNVLELPFADDSFDYVLAFDIFEHLSLSGMEQAMAEAMRVARSGLVLTFFIMEDVPEHTERPKKNYHNNILSASRIQDLLRPQFPQTDATHIRTFLRQQFPGAWYYAKRGWTVTAER